MIDQGLPILEVRNVSKHYAGHTALDNVSIAVPKQSIFGLLGPNGAGKTSLIRIITQITGADEGKILINNEPLQPKHIAQIGYLPEERGLYKKMKVGEQLMYLGRLKGLSKHEIRHKLKYWADRFEIGGWWNKAIEDLSKGMQQKVQFVATVLHGPQLIILDEPFSGFDPINANLIKDEILNLRNNGATIIFSTHRMESVEELCDHIALIHRSKKILDGKKSAVKKAYQTQTFKVETDRPFESELPYFEVLGCKELEDQLFQHTVKLHQGTANDLVQKLVSSVELHGLQEIIPTMNEIFIRVVGSNGKEIAL
jgi:ABC-2 type transport system ATP-binding protein